MKHLFFSVVIGVVLVLTCSAHSTTPAPKIDQPQQARAINANNVYSPDLLMQNAHLVMFFGGWYSPGQTHDDIYRTNCPRIGKCAPATEILDSKYFGFNHLNDPSIVRLASGEYLMYMTGIRPDRTSESANHVYLSTSQDARHWSAPVRVASDIWMPSATIDAHGDVLLYGNANYDGTIILYNMGQNGQTPLSRVVLQTPKPYANVDVRYHKKQNKFEILAEVNEPPPNQIDYLESKDGIRWKIVDDGIIKPHAGMITVRTPAANPGTEHIVYYGETNDPNSTRNKIWVRRW